jgi:hypothetical protein
MTKQIPIREAVTDAPVKKGNRWRVIVAKPGQGSSGTYSEDLFRRDAHKIIAPGGQAFINHDDSRNPKDMLGTYPEGSFWSEEDRAVVSELEVFSHWKEFVEEVGPHCGVSLYALGEQDDEGNVTAIIEDRLNGADLVARPGLVGSGLAEKLYESAIAGSDDTKATAVVEGKDNDMEFEKVVEAISALTAQVEALVADKNSAVAVEAQVQADAEAVAEAVASFEAAVKAVDDAELLAPQKTEILEAAKKGADVTPLIESAKAIKEAALAAVSAEAVVTEGRVLGGDSKGFSLTKIAEAR